MAKVQVIFQKSEKSYGVRTAECKPASLPNILDLIHQQLARLFQNRDNDLLIKTIDN